MTDDPRGIYCLCNHSEARHSNGNAECLDCNCDLFRWDPIYEPPKAEVPDLDDCADWPPEFWR